MRRLVVLGAGTAGTMVVNALRPRLARSDWEIVVVEPSDVHYYQPGFLFIPFGRLAAKDVVKPVVRFVPDGVRLVRASVDRVLPDDRRVLLTGGPAGVADLTYDYLVVATGTTPRPDQTPGFDTSEWGRSIHEFYTFEGACALAEALRGFDGGRLVVQVVEMPVKCPVAPLEFAFLADAHLADRGVRGRTDLVYVTPLEGAFTKPVSSRRLGRLLEAKGIALEPDFVLERVDADRRTLVSYDEREVGYDLLVTVPVNMGAEFVARSGLGDELNHVRVDKGTFLSRASDRVFALGDASDIPASKAGSVAHFAVEVFVENFLAHVDGLPMPHRFDGHANCFVETGHDKALLIDFNYETEPLPGRFPLAHLGPLSLLEETRANHLGKLAFRWVYWNVLLPGRPLPVGPAMSMAGKRLVDA